MTVDTLLPYISETANADAVLRQRRKKKEGKCIPQPSVFIVGL